MEITFGNFLTMLVVAASSVFIFATVTQKVKNLEETKVDELDLERELDKINIRLERIMFHLGIEEKK